MVRTRFITAIALAVLTCASQSILAQSSPSFQHGRWNYFTGTIKEFAWEPGMPVDDPLKWKYTLMYLNQHEDAVFYISANLSRYFGILPEGMTTTSKPALVPGQRVRVGCHPEIPSKGHEVNELKRYAVIIFETK